MRTNKILLSAFIVSAMIAGSASADDFRNTSPLDIDAPLNTQSQPASENCNYNAHANLCLKLMGGATGSQPIVVVKRVVAAAEG